MRVYFVAGIIASIVNALLNFFELPETFWVGFAKGSTFGLVFVVMAMGLLYTSGYMAKLVSARKRHFDGE